MSTVLTQCSIFYGPMALSDSDLTNLVTSPSLSGVIYQARTLISELGRVNDEEFPRETRLVRDVFLCIAEHILDELQGMRKPDYPYVLTERQRSRVVSLAKILREYHSYIRYLLASSPRQSPPAVQAALVQLTERHFPKEYGEPICIVRPQWSYNLKSVQIAQILKTLPRSVLDPDKKLGVKRKESIFPALWAKRVRRLKDEGEEVLSEKAPTHIGVLSFAAIDTPDALLLPLLGHELAHFLAFSHPTPLHEEKPFRDSYQISEDEVKKVILEVTKKYPTPRDNRYWRLLDNLVSTCMRELLADLLAARMLGLSFS